jgi:hypothetical protein
VDNPPQIISYDIPEVIESYYYFDINVIAEDDIGVAEVYLDIGNLGRMDLTEDGGSWQEKTRLLKTGEYQYTIIVVDSNGQEATAEDIIKCVVPTDDDDEVGEQPDGGDYLPY